MKYIKYLSVLILRFFFSLRDDVSSSLLLYSWRVILPVFLCVLIRDFSQSWRRNDASDGATDEWKSDVCLLFVVFLSESRAGSAVLSASPCVIPASFFLPLLFVLKREPLTARHPGFSSLAYKFRVLYVLLPKKEACGRRALTYTLTCTHIIQQEKSHRNYKQLDYPTLSNVPARTSGPRWHRGVGTFFFFIFFL